MISSVRPATTNASAFLSGWVGDHHASVSMYRSGDSVSLNGRVGDASVNVWQHGASGASSNLTGSIFSRRGSWPVSVWVNGSEGSRNYSGRVGSEFVSLHESRWGDGVSLSGWIGNRYVNASAENRNGWIRFDGRVGHGFDGRVDLSGSQNPSEPPLGHEALIPLLALAGLPRE